LGIRFAQAKKIPHQAGLDCSCEPHRLLQSSTLLAAAADKQVGMESPTLNATRIVADSAAGGNRTDFQTALSSELLPVFVFHYNQPKPARRQYHANPDYHSFQTLFPVAAEIPPCPWQFLGRHCLPHHE
jgi:hypothetical protein